MKTKFYKFYQNNSGGHFDIDLDSGLNQRVIIEACDKYQALDVAYNIGIYFDGVEKEIDCECCGDRWCSPSELELEELIDEVYSGTSIHYLSGEIQNV